jgi:hypothetical protein
MHEVLLQCQHYVSTVSAQWQHDGSTMAAQCQHSVSTVSTTTVSTTVSAQCQHSVSTVSAQRQHSVSKRGNTNDVTTRSGCFYGALNRPSKVLFWRAESRSKPTGTYHMEILVYCDNSDLGVSKK